MLALSVICFLSGITVPILNALSHIKTRTETFYQDEMGIYQLQLELALHDVLEVNYDSILYRKNNDTFILHIVNDKLLSQPGSEDFIHGISEAVFEVEDRIIWFSFQRRDQWHRYPIGYFYEE